MHVIRVDFEGMGNVEARRQAWLPIFKGLGVAVSVDYKFEPTNQHINPDAYDAYLGELAAIPFKLDQVKALCQ